jgi:hypothetical protein
VTIHSHSFVETYEGMVAFGLDRETDEHTLTYYLQKFSDDEVLEHLIPKLPDADLEALFNTLDRILKSHFSTSDYHRIFLKEGKAHR